MKFTGNNQSEIEHIVNQINDFLDTRYDISSFEVLKYDGKTLIVAASFDFCYYHNIEIYFTDVYFFSGDFQWSRNEDLKAIEITNKYIDKNQHTTRLKFTFNTDNVLYSNPKEKIEIWASGIDFNTDTVLYHKPKKLEKGQRLADWLK